MIPDSEVDNEILIRYFNEHKRKETMIPDDALILDFSTMVTPQNLILYVACFATQRLIDTIANQSCVYCDETYKLTHVDTRLMVIGQCGSDRKLHVKIIGISNCTQLRIKGFYFKCLKKVAPIYEVKYYIGDAGEAFYIGCHVIGIALHKDIVAFPSESRLLLSKACGRPRDIRLAWIKERQL